MPRLPAALLGDRQSGEDLKPGLIAHGWEQADYSDQVQLEVQSVAHWKPKQ